ncbi:MAG: spore coat associated protein CotJA [Lachnospiraceae bacterium]
MDYSYSRQLNDRRNSYSQTVRGRSSCGCNQNMQRPVRSPKPSCESEPRRNCSQKCERMPADRMLLDELPLGMTYVPMQRFENLYSAEQGLQAGTIFQDLDFPFLVGICARGCERQ